MSTRLHVVQCFAVLLLAGTSQSATLPDALTHWLDGLGGDSLQVQLAVMDLADPSGALLYGRQSDQRQTPASLVKLCTVALALELRGPQHRLVTRAGYDPARVKLDRRSQQRRADGVWIQPVGDPTLTRQDLVRLLHHIWQDGVDQLAGPVRILPNGFDGRRLGPGWMWDDAGAAFAARPSQLTVQGNCLQALAGPHGWELPGSTLMRVNIEAAARGATPMLERDWRRASDDFTFMAPLPPVQPPLLKSGWRARTTNPSCSVEYPDSLFRSVSFEAAQEVFETAQPPRLNWKGPFPAGLVWFQHVGPPLIQIVDSVLTESWNLGAECLFQGLAAERSRPGVENWDRAAELSRTVLRDSLGVSGWFRQVDGSGMSRYNAVSPRQFVQLLAGMERRHPGLLAHLLPEPGEGTLRSYAPTMPNGVRMAAKTGSLRGVTSLAGYMLAGDQPRLAFCLIITGQQSGATAVNLRNQMVNRLAGWLAKPAG